MGYFAATKNIDPPTDHLLSIEADGQKLLAGVQPFGGSQTALHIVAAGAPNMISTVALHRAAVWAEELRRKLERKVCSPTAEAPELSP
jgi:hypothetical protein